MNASDRLSTAAFRLLLRAYPAEFRAAYGHEVLQLLRDQLRDHRGAVSGCAGAAHSIARTNAQSVAGFWAAVVWDVARSAPGLQLDEARARWRVERDHSAPRSSPLQQREATMKTDRSVAILAVLGGAFQVLNTGAEIWAARGGPLWGRSITGWPLAMVLATLVGVLLLTAGLARIRQRKGEPGATRLARGAAFACLALVVGLQFTFPFMSIFSRLLGVGIPIALLLATGRPRGGAGRNPSVTVVA